MNWEEIKVELEKKLNPKHVVKPSSNFGPKGDYIEGWHAIAEANRIFGFGGWSYSIHSLDKCSLIEAKDSKGKDQWQAAYTCVVTLEVGEVVRQDVGFGSGYAAKQGDAIEGATKEAVTDALKRCLRTFGNQFGLALYDKSRANVGVDMDPWAKTIVDELSPAATDREKAEAITSALIYQWGRKPSPGQLSSEWDRRANIISHLQATNPDLHEKVVDGYHNRLHELEEAA